MDGGSYARVSLFTLEDDQKVVGRVVLPVRETVKTEAEVAAMELVRGTVPLVLLQSHMNQYSFSTHPHTCATSLPLL
jgi:hypothetical protein